MFLGHVRCPQRTRRRAGLWLNEYAPEDIETEASRYPQISNLAAGLGGTWDARYGHVQQQPYFEGALVLVVSTPE